MERRGPREGKLTDIQLLGELPTRLEERSPVYLSSTHGHGMILIK